MRSLTRSISTVSLFALMASASTRAHAQLTLTSAVDLALKNSPQVKMAQADVARAIATRAETRDAYIPTVTGNSSAGGYSLGFPLSVPSVFTITAQSLVFSFSQRDYLRSANAGLTASNLALNDMREQVAADVVETYISLDSAQSRRKTLGEEASMAEHLTGIVKDRLDAGQDTPMELIRVRRTGVQIRLQMLQLDDEIATYRDHLARLVGLPGVPVTTLPESIPSVAEPASTLDPGDSAAVRSAFANARAKREQAFGDARYTMRPRFAFGAEYSRVSTFNNSYSKYYPSVSGLQTDAFGFSVDVSIPFFDVGHNARARAAMAEAVHAEHEADYARDQEREGRLKLRHNIAELAARAELAALDRDFAQGQLDVVLLQMQAPAPGVQVQATPKDEQNARIQERQRYLDVLDAQAQLQQVRIKLLRQTGQLLPWLQSAAAHDQVDLKSVP